MLILEDPEIAYKDVFECHTKFGDYYDNPQKYNIKTSTVVEIKEIQDIDEYVFIGKMTDRNVKDLNEYQNLLRRQGRKIDGNNLFMNLSFEDDSDMIVATIDRFKFLRFNKLLIDDSKIGDWFLIKGEIKSNWRKVHINNIRKL